MPIVFDLPLPPLALERGGEVAPHVARGFCWGPASDASRLDALPTERDVVVQRASPPALAAPRPLEEAPTVLVVHALTGDARADLWWGPVIGPGKALDPRRCRILCFNLLGSCYGSSGPCDGWFPEGAEVTTNDQARALLLALEALGIGRLELCVGGSLGALVTLSLAALAPSRVKRIAPIAGAITTGAWVAGWNHVARGILELDEVRGLSLARQLATMTYRAEAGLDRRQPRRELDHPVRGYLDHQGRKLARRFDPRAYRTLLGAMDSHDLAPRLERIAASVLAVAIDNDRLFLPEGVAALAEALRRPGRLVEEATIRSPHGHDAFLIEWPQVAAVLERALSLEVPTCFA